MPQEAPSCGSERPLLRGRADEVGVLEVRGEPAHGDHDQRGGEDRAWIERCGSRSSSPKTAKPAALETHVTKKHTAAVKAAAVFFEVTPEGFEPSLPP